jgi:endonuclease/exonuclease/phosphatase (EEP) superfamily protein YafD
MSVFLILGSLWVKYIDDYISLFFSVTLPIIAIANILVFVWGLFKKKKWLFIPIMGLLVFYMLFGSFFQLNFEPKDSQTETLSILTFNVAGFVQKDGTSIDNRYDKITDFINKQDADIVLFQEFSHIKLDVFKNYKYAFYGYRENVSKSLQVIISKYPIKNKGYIDFKDTRNNAMYIDLLIKGEKVRIYNLHLQSFKIRSGDSKRVGSTLSKITRSQKMRKQQVDLIINDMKNFGGKVIVAGDFNNMQFSSTYLDLVKDKKDTFIDKGYGLGRTYVLKGYPFRLDYILVDESIEVVSHKNFKLNYSDHEPIKAKLFF